MRVRVRLPKGLEIPKTFMGGHMTTFGGQSSSDLLPCGNRNGGALARPAVSIWSARLRRRAHFAFASSANFTGITT